MENVAEVTEKYEQILQKKDHLLEAKNALIEKLEAELRLLRIKIYRSKSEKQLDSPQQDLFRQDLFNELEQLADEPSSTDEQTDDTTEVKAHKRKARKSRALSSELPRVEVLHDLPEHEKRCQCGLPKKRIGEEIQEQLAIIPAKYYVIRHIRPKYTCDCDQCSTPPVLAPAPKQALPKSQASAQLLAFLMTAKFLDGLPLYRLEKITQRCGLEVSRQNMARWLIQASHWFDPLLTAFNQALNAYDIQGADETRLQVLQEPGRKATQKSWLWIRQGGSPNQPVVLLHYDTSRAASVPKTLLSGYENGKLVVDGYAAYQSVAKENNLTLVNCHDHARRKFKAAWDSLTVKQKQVSGGIAYLALERYKKLYKIEALLKKKEANLEEILNTRQSQSLPELKAFKIWCEQVQAKGIANQMAQQAISYFLNHYDGLIQYCSDARLPISNIGTEHVAKQIAIVRKNFLFANTPSGATASAGILSILLTAIANGHEPHQYLTVLLTELPKLGHHQPDISPWLPWTIKPDKVSELYKTYPTL